MKRASFVVVMGAVLLAGCAKKEATQDSTEGGVKGARADHKLEYPVEVAPLALRHV